jgi:hypothetical protein
LIDLFVGIIEHDPFPLSRRIQRVGTKLIEDTGVEAEYSGKVQMEPGAAAGGAGRDR